MSIRYAVIEDELFTRQRLVQTIRRLRPEMELLFEGGSVSEAIRFLKEGSAVDLMFMDVELSDGNCFQIFDAVSSEIPIIFTTAFDQFALRAFQSYGIGYIMKPYADEEILRAIERFENLRNMPQGDNERDLSTIYENIATEVRRNNRRILTISGDNYDYINLDDIVSFEMEDGIIFVSQKGGKRKLTNFHNMQAVMASVQPEDFFQVGRGIVLNISSISKVTKHFRGRLIVRYIIGNEEREIMVSSSRRQNFLDWLGNS